MAKVLERVWDKAEDYGGDTALSKTNHGLFEQIDRSPTRRAKHRIPPR